METTRLRGRPRNRWQGEVREDERIIGGEVWQEKVRNRLKNTIIDKTLTYASETRTLTKRDRKQLNIFERKVYRRILGPVYGNEKGNWRILTNKEIYARDKNPTIIETIRLNRLCWFGHVQRMEGNGIPKKVLYMILFLSFRRVLNVNYSFLGNSPASEF